MPILARSEEEFELERLAEREQEEREAARSEAEREHEYRLAKLKYSTAGRFRMWGRILIAFAKAPAWFVLACTLKGDAPEHWKKFLDI